MFSGRLRIKSPIDTAFLIRLFQSLEFFWARSGPLKSLISKFKSWYWLDDAERLIFIGSDSHWLLLISSSRAWQIKLSKSLRYIGPKDEREIRFLNWSFSCLTWLLSSSIFIVSWISLRNIDSLFSELKVIRTYALLFIDSLW